MQRPRNAPSLALTREAGVLELSGGCSLPSQEGEGFASLREDGAPCIGNPAYVTRPLATGLGAASLVPVSAAFRGTYAFGHDPCAKLDLRP